MPNVDVEAGAMSFHLRHLDGPPAYLRRRSGDWKQQHDIALGSTDAEANS
jgi:hypothetical protein